MVWTLFVFFVLLIVSLLPNCFYVFVLLFLCFCSVYSFILFLSGLDILSQKHLLKLFQSFEVLFIVELDSVYGRALQLHDADDNDDDVDNVEQRRRRR